MGLEHKGAKWLKILIELALQWGRKTSNQAIKQTNKQQMNKHTTVINVKEKNNPEKRHKKRFVGNLNRVATEVLF